MNSNLVRTVGSVGQDNLIAKLHPAAETIGIRVRARAGKLARGSVLAKSSRDNKLVLLGTAAADAVDAAAAVYGKTADEAIVSGKTYYTRSGTEGNYTYAAVASPVVGDIETYYEVTTPAVEAQAAEVLTVNCILADPVDASGESDVTAVAYRCGNFNQGALTVAASYTISDSDVDKLRQYDIILTDVM